jgi:hypothetical protein
LIADKLNEELRRELLAMVDEEQELHTRLSESGEIYGGYHPALEELNLRQALRLEQIIETQGWPGTSLVGSDGAHAAWFTAIHAISRPAFQRRCLGLLRDAVERGEVPAAQAAFMEDKIAFMERRPQRYGTQFDWDEKGQMSPWTLAEAEHVDELRAGVGLGPLKGRIEEFRASDEGRPTDSTEYSRRFEAWRRKVGWVDAGPHPA